ncbi:OprO/OprP family phosphate-selective porin [Endozoicomonadaceae bacterium StTr2]
MKSRLLPLVAAIALTTQATAGVVKTDGEDIIISTKGGLKLETADKQFSFKLSGKLQWDYAGYDDIYAQENAASATEKRSGRTGYIRRAEIGLSGKAYDDWKYKLKLEKDSDDKIELGDAKITYTGIKPVDITVGRWGFDYGLENTTSSSWIMGIERPMIYDALNGDEGNDYGIEVATAGKNYTVALGIHRQDENKDVKNSKKDQFGFAMRGTFAPVMTDDMLVHLGVNYYNANPDKNAVGAAKTRIGVKKAEKQSLFSNIASAKDDTEYTLEAALQFQSLQLQAEYFNRNIKAEAANSDVKLSGYYGQVSYMVDGGKRSYKDGAFGKPKGGSIEVFARFSDMTVDADSAVSKGYNNKDVEVSSYTLGVNYFPTKNIRASLNYVSGQLDNYTGIKNVSTADDDGSAVVGRLQYVF